MALERQVMIQTLKKALWSIANNTILMHIKFLGWNNMI